MCCSSSQPLLLRAGIIVGEMPVNSYMVVREKRKESAAGGALVAGGSERGGERKEERERSGRSASHRRKRAHALTEPSHRSLIRFSLASLVLFSQCVLKKAGSTTTISHGWADVAFHFASKLAKP